MLDARAYHLVLVLDGLQQGLVHGVKNMEDCHVLLCARDFARGQHNAHERPEMVILELGAVEERRGEVVGLEDSL